jgi:hypothetical protein
LLSGLIRAFKEAKEEFDRQATQPIERPLTSATNENPKANTPKANTPKADETCPATQSPSAVGSASTSSDSCPAPKASGKDERLVQAEAGSKAGSGPSLSAAKAGQDSRPTEEKENLPPKTGKSGQDSGKSGQDSGKSGQQTGESGQEAGKSGQEAGKSGQEAGKSGQEAGKSGQDCTESRHQTDESGQDVGKPGQENIKTGPPTGQPGQPAGTCVQETGKSDLPTGKAEQKPSIAGFDDYISLGKLTSGRLTQLAINRGHATVRSYLESLLKYLVD